MKYFKIDLHDDHLAVALVHYRRYCTKGQMLSSIFRGLESRRLMNWFIHTRSLKIQILLCTIITWGVAAPEGDPQWNCSRNDHFIVLHLNGTRSCEPCAKCPVGQGLSKQCGSQIPAGTKIECQDCEPGKSYSDTDGRSTCQPCEECDRRVEVIKKCSADQNRICGTKCTKGWFMHPVADDCHECFYCCSNTTEDARVPQCKDSGMPRHMQCERTTQNERCKKESMTTPSTLGPTPVATSVQELPRTRDNNTQSSLSLYEQDSGKIKKNKSEKPQHSSSLTGILCGTLIPVVIIFITIALVCYLKRRRSTSGQPPSAEVERQGSTSIANRTTEGSAVEVNQIRTVTLGNSTATYRIVPDSDSGSSAELICNEDKTQGKAAWIPDGRNIPEGVPISKILDLGELLEKLKSLDLPEKRTRKNWKNVARLLPFVTNDKLEEIELDNQSPTEGLLKYLKTSGPKEPTVDKLFDALVKSVRYDLAENVSDWSWVNRSAE